VICEAWAKQTPTQSVAQQVAHHIANTIGHLALPQVTPLMIGAIVASWKQRYAKSTAYGYRSKLAHLLATMAAMGAPAIRPPKIAPPPARPTVATHGELVRLLSDPAPWLRLFILLYLQCGLRRAETLRVTPRSWNRDEHTAAIVVKGGDTRTTPLTPDVELLLEAAGDVPPDTNYLSALKGKTVTFGMLRDAWNAHKKKHQVNPNVTAHDLRRTAATIVMNATHDLRAAQHLLGHKNLTSTIRYIAPLDPTEARKYQELLRFEHFKSEVKQ
jgi:integrase